MYDDTTILRFRQLMEKQQLAPQVLRIINEGLSIKGLMLKTGSLVDVICKALKRQSRLSAIGAASAGGAALLTGLSALLRAYAG